MQEVPQRKQWIGKGGKVSIQRIPPQFRLIELHQVAAVASVLVNEQFMKSHTFLKASSAVIRGAKVASPVHSQSHQTASETLSTKMAIEGALEQAVLAPDDIQIVELRHGSNMSAQQALGALNVTEDGHASPISNPFVGSTGLGGLCELGKCCICRSLIILSMLMMS